MSNVFFNRIELTEEELRALENFYRLAGSSTEYPYQINYVAFVDEVSIVFTTTVRFENIKEFLMNIK